MRKLFVLIFMCLVSIQVTYETQRLYKYHKNTSQVRLLKMQEIQSHNDELHRNLVRTLNIRRNQDIILQKYRLDLSTKFALKQDMDCTLRQRKGAAKWPLWVVQLICELLVSGTPPTSIPSNTKIFPESALLDRAGPLYKFWERLFWHTN